MYEMYLLFYSVRKTKCDAGPNHVHLQLQSVTHIEQSEKSDIHIDRPPESMWMTEFYVTYMFCSCVTLGFSNSDTQQTVF
jgi:hypothetical protein